ncbi:AraC family transcriptional regulator [Arenibacter sp. H213]|uniref:Helix-turn-helix domain-containing protein n=1 Tax=Arenibacter antarcticus TaxID=2040469 RepID=A0ABW5VII0_9FLAO|nr:AraC family transcriptional regulator [Arenibacter sp. H213]
MIFAQFTWANSATVFQNINCNPIEIDKISLESIAYLSAKECFELGKCEYDHNNFSTAYTFFLSAHLKGHENTVIFNKYFAASKTSLDSLQQINEQGFNFLNKLNSSSFLSLSEPLNANERNVLETSHRWIQNYVRNYLFLLIAICGFYLAIKLLIEHRKAETHNIYLAVFLFGVSVMLMELAINWLSIFNYNPRVYFFKIHFFLWAPSLYLYIRKKLHIGSKTSINEFLKHYGVFILFSMLLLIGVNTETPVDGTTFFNHTITIILTSLFIKAVHITLYVLLLIVLYKKHKDTLNQSNKKWLILSISFLGLLMLIVFSRALFSHLDSFNYISIYFTAIALSLFISLYATMHFIQPDIITKTEALKETGNDVKYKNSGLTEAMTDTLKSQLVRLVETKKVYLDNAITLEKLAKDLNTDRYSLSQVINQEFGKNFYEFINDYRVQEVVNMIKNNEGNIKLVTDLIYESGFNNKVSFYKAFKKRHKMTPTQFIKLQSNHLLIKN